MATPIRTGDTAVSTAQIQRYAADFHSSPANRVRMNAVTKSGIQSVATDRDAVARMQYTFSEEIDTGSVTNQKQSGRCWLFAGLNTIRQDIATSHHMAPFELSQSYQMFWDKFEKANYFLERILDTVDEDTDSRIVQWLLQAPLQDGGQWDMFVNLVEKYGVVPQYVMAESYHSSKSAVMNRLLTSKLRKEASDYRARYREGTPISDLREKKHLFLGEFYRLLCYFLGTPPATFDFEYRDHDNVFHRDTGLTPQTFFEQYARFDLKDYVSIIHAPTSDKPYDRTYTVKYLGNVEGGNDVMYLNVDIETVKQLALAQIQDGESVWFGCDVGKLSDSESGIMDARLFDYEGALDTSFAMTKAERLDYGESVMTHAMVFTGANVIDGKVNRWKVQNSWGKDAGKDGFFVMSDAWFDDYMYQIVVNKKHLSEDNLSALAQTPIELSPWDPMGSLAMMR
ncbi:C1 family peptidase [Alicyclobacillus fastidiosus]|uniref:Aminopeptidase n=1 Tax=Alicyclobacillus fastidiosus TaxID=392011 RepID=A0ABV5AER5_9BACL|nr:C1 family peptidase [Alicyclobacillus fastidiosus]WEH09861.1 C1 family peptidase [Alicyclobacillus fastidiosus]